MQTIIDPVTESSAILLQLKQLRHHLHKHPELSGKEYKTAEHILQFFKKYEPTEILDKLGSGTGIVAIWDSGKQGKTVLFRTELDALPIEEANTDLDYCSSTKGVSHKCGHDGHATMVAGLAPFLQQKQFRGKVGLLFQPAEETGEGAIALINDERFKAVQPDYIFGLHNLPGCPKAVVHLQNESVCPASCGMKIILEGLSSHAAEPEKAITPSACIVSLLQSVLQLPSQLQTKALSIVTATHVSMGEATFGITPGQAVVHFTLRAFHEGDMKKLIASAEQLVRDAAAKDGLKYNITYHDGFPVTYNHPEAFDLMKKAAELSAMKMIVKEEPFRWSEDFGHYAKLCKIGFFGLGSGEEIPNLHNPSYDFPDDIIPYGMKMYQKIIELINGM